MPGTGKPSQLPRVSEVIDLGGEPMITTFIKPT